MQPSHLGVDDFSVVGFFIVKNVVLGNRGIHCMDRDVERLVDMVDFAGCNFNEVVILSFKLLQDLWVDPFLKQVECGISEDHLPSKEGEMHGDNGSSVFKPSQGNQAVLHGQSFSIGLSEFLDLVTDIIHENVVI